MNYRNKLRTSGEEAVLEETSSPMLPDPNILMFYENLENRILWLDTNITKDSLEIVRHIHSFNRADHGVPVNERKPIRLMIHTDGGDLDVAFSIADAIRASSTPVYTINTGTAASGGFLVLISGHRRFCMPHSSAMIHPGSAKFSGTFGQFQHFASDYARAINEMSDFVRSRTSLDQETLDKLWNSDLYLSASEQLGTSTVDEIISEENRSVLL